MEFTIDKIINYLIDREGFEFEALTNREKSVILRDVFGYRYEITVTRIGRTQIPRETHQDIIDLFTLTNQTQTKNSSET